MNANSLTLPVLYLKFSSINCLSVQARIKEEGCDRLVTVNVKHCHYYDTSQTHQ